jgi:osmotically-inducible protein OsmY
MVGRASGQGVATMTTGDRSDEQIQREIRERFVWEPEIEGAGITVTVVDGIAILEGAARGYQRAAAERIAGATPGVRAVEDRLRLIDPLHPDDETLLHLAASALAADPVIPAGQVGVAVRNGIVELSGEVQRGAERAAAEAAVLDLPGVIDVRNAITVVGSPPQAAGIESAIRETFVTEAAKAAAEIAVSLDGALATLTGTVPTPHYRQLAETVAWNVPGVSEVRNELRVGS